MFRNEECTKHGRGGGKQMCPCGTQFRNFGILLAECLEAITNPPSLPQCLIFTGHSEIGHPFSAITLRDWTHGRGQGGESQPNVYKL
jgi:hypothetical protein